MQIVVRVKWKVEEYIQEQLHQRMRAPALCPNCRKRNTLTGHGSYRRFTTNQQGGWIDFRVPRFWCSNCGITVSGLADFAQPYRLVASATIQAFFRGERRGRDITRNEGLLKRYWKRFVRWHPHLTSLIGHVFGRAPPKETATVFWQRAVAACGSLAELTVRLVQDFRTTCFGTYRCHPPAFAH